MVDGYRESYSPVNFKTYVAPYHETYSVASVSVGERISERLKILNLSQSELARRTGLAQPTINALIKRNKVGSKYLHRIAAELATTPAYLTGETDDPDPGYEPTLSLSSDEREVIELLRGMSVRDKSAFLHVVRMIQGGVANTTLHAPRDDYASES